MPPRWLLRSITAMTTSERFWAKVDTTGECWLWTASINPSGYGQFYDSERKGPVLAHRVAWMLAGNEIPEDMCVLHRCDVRNCVRVDHLFIGTKRDNSLDMAAKGRWRNQSEGKTECPKGHPYDFIDTNGKRRCRRCAREAGRRAYWKAKG